jgi:hypothetical protein
MLVGENGQPLSTQLNAGLQIPGQSMEMSDYDKWAMGEEQPQAHTAWKYQDHKLDKYRELIKRATKHIAALSHQLETTLPETLQELSDLKVYTEENLVIISDMEEKNMKLTDRIVELEGDLSGKSNR